MNILNYTRCELKKNAENDFQKFSSSLIPNIDNVLGVKLPVLRKIAKTIVKDDWETFLNKYEEKYMEDTMLKGLVITYLKEDFDKMTALVCDFVPKINNWAVCDTFCMGLKFFKKDKDKTFKFLAPYLKSNDEFHLRFACVVLLAHFIDEDYIDEVLNILFNLKSCGYYAGMAIAWAISICYIKFPDKTLKYLLKDNLDDFCHNKAISKIIESYRVTKKDKDKLKLLKRKKVV